MARTPRTRTAPTRAFVRRIRLGAAVVGVAAALFAGWWFSRPAAKPRLDVLLVTVDTLRADALGAYGNVAAETPRMDGLAAGGVRFEEAHAHNVVTLPSHANILSGLYPFDHGVRDNAGFRFPPTLDTLATLLRGNGYRTGAFVSAFPLDSRFGLARGFDVYDDDFVDARPQPAFLEQERPATETVDRALRWLHAPAGRPSFCWVHVYEPHFPYDPPEPFASRFVGDPYHGEVAAADAALGPLLDPIVAAGPRGHTLVVLTADHGESLGEHGEATHGIFAYEATLRVPLVIYLPSRLAPRVVATPVRHVDILPTVLDALSLPVPRGLPGRSLLPLAGEASLPASTSYFEALAGSLNRGWAPLYGVVEGSRKYIDLPLPELYDLPRDPGETQNLAADRPQELAASAAALAGLPKKDRRIHRVAEDQETRERLSSLGYVWGNAVERRYTEGDDPKRLIGLDAELQGVTGLYLAGDLAGALARCRELVRMRPRMGVSLLQLAQLEQESGNLPAAIGALQQALALNREDAATAALLGSYLTQAGRAREAADLLEHYRGLGAPDLEVRIARALALAKLGRTGDALAILGEAHDGAKVRVAILMTRGTVNLMAGDREAARRAFEEALARNPGVARAHSSLAFMAAEEGRRDDALGHWRQAISLDAGEVRTLLALVRLLGRGGRATEARGYLELLGSPELRDRLGRETAEARQPPRRRP